MNLPRNRWLAFASHFGLSLILFVVILLIIVFFWYPGALFTAAGGWQGIRIVIGVDLVIGPLLTLIIYNINKPRKVLFRDLSVIALIQLSCLIAGVFVVFDERPVAVTYAYNKFYALKHSDFIANGKDPKDIRLNLMTPKTFYINLKKTSDKTGIDQESLANLYDLLGESLAYRTDLYEVFPDTRKDAISILKGADKSMESNTGCITVELISAYEQGNACFDPNTLKFIDFRKEQTN